MSIIGWIIIGGLAGWLANAIMGRDGGLVMNIILGIVGAFIGGFIMSMVDGQGITGFNLWSFVLALGGSLVLLLIANAIVGSRV